MTSDAKRLLDAARRRPDIWDETRALRTELGFGDPPLPDAVVALLLKPGPATLDEMDSLTAWTALIGVERIIRSPEWVNWLDHNRAAILKASVDLGGKPMRMDLKEKP